MTATASRPRYTREGKQHDQDSDRDVVIIKYIIKNLLRGGNPMNRVKKYGYIWISLILFLGSFIGHWTFAWYAYVSEQSAHNQQVVFQDYLVEVSRDTLENWQSKFFKANVASSRVGVFLVRWFTPIQGWR
jgi:hypothetical protein